MTETWLTPDVPDQALFFSNYAIFRGDRQSYCGRTKHGGTLIAVKQTPSLRCTKIENGFPDEDCVVIEAKIVDKLQTQRSLIICCLYNPPRNSPFLWNHSKLETLIGNLVRMQTEIDAEGTLLIGDLNFNNTNWGCLQSTDAYESPFLDVLIQHNFQQHIASSSSLDVVLSNNPDLILDTTSDFSMTKNYSLHDRKLSDHKAIRCEISMSTNAIAFKPLKVAEDLDFSVFSISKANWSAVESHIRREPFNPYCYSNVNVLTSCWYKWLFKILESNVPVKTRHRRCLPPWASKESSHLIKCSETIQRSLNKKRTLLKLIKLKRIQKSVRLQLMKDQTCFEERVFKGRRFPDIQKYLKTIRKTSRSPEILKWNSEVAETELSMAELLNGFFQSVFLPETVDKNLCYSCIHDDCISKISFSELQVETILTKLSPNKAAGPDGMSSSILKSLSNSLSKSISLLFQTCLNKCEFPSAWKIADITAIHKGNSLLEVENYRPVSLLDTMSKVLEKVLYDTVEAKIRKSLHESQFGFTPRRSPDAQMICFLSELYQELNNPSVDLLSVIYLDVSKAFDRVDHDLLLQRLQQCGICKNLLQVFRSYLSGRYQRVSVKGYRSSLLKVTSGVPQGSCLGPLFFLIYINDLLCKLDSVCFAYADDIKIICKNKALTEKDLKTIEIWCSKNSMNLNPRKVTELRLRNNQNSNCFFLNNVQIQRVEVQKDLGYLVNEKLSWKNHVENRCKKATSAFFQIKRNLANDSHSFLKLDAYCGYIMPILSYGSHAIFPNVGETKLLEKVQRRAVSWITGAQTDDYKGRLRNLKLLPVSLYFEMHDLLVLSSILNQKTGIQWTRYLRVNDNSSRHSSVLFQIPATSKKQKQDFWYRVARLANIFGPILDLSADTEHLKSKLLIVYWNFFENYYNEMTPCTWRIICGCPIGTCAVNKKI